MSAVFHVTYLLSLSGSETPEERILALQLEQSAELPDSVVESMGVSGVKGVVTARYQPDPQHVVVTIAWPSDNHAAEITQFFNILFGNISLKQGIAILDIQWNDLAPHLFKGPAWGIDRIRKSWNIPGRALSCTALKPMGFPTGDLADAAYRFALGGIDIIKDDHGITNQAPAPFRDRVTTCVEALERAAQKTGRRSRYFPNITTDPHLVSERYEMAAELGADGVLFAPVLSGPALMHHLAQSSTDLPIMAHPAFSGSLIAHHPHVLAQKKGERGPVVTRQDGDIHAENGRHGFEPGLFYGALWRALGADFVIYPNSGGRFSFSAESCGSINHEARRGDLPFVPSFPAPGGGMQRDRMEHWLRRYGNDTTFLIGGNLYEDPEGLESASRAFMEVIR